MSATGVTLLVRKASLDAAPVAIAGLTAAGGNDDRARVRESVRDSARRRDRDGQRDDAMRVHGRERRHEHGRRTLRSARRGSDGSGAAPRKRGSDCERSEVARDGYAIPRHARAWV